MLVLASVTILTLDYHGEANRALGHVRNGFRSALAPIQRAISDVLHPIGDVFAGAFRYGTLQSANQRLQDQVGSLSQQLEASSAATSQLRQIASLDHLSWTGITESVLARVTSAPTSNFDYTLEIDQGTSAGVGPGMPVVGGKGFVGTVLSASSHTATVQLVSDPRSHVGVRFGTSANANAIAVASGQGPNQPLASSTTGYVPLRGELVFTSGLTGELYPPGLPVGVVASARPEAGNLSETVVITPLVDIPALEYVRVLLWNPPA